MNINWHSIFIPSEPILETIIRGTVMYLVLFVVLRLTLDELLTQLHRAGLEGIRQVREAYMEGDGSITFICDKE